MSDAKLFVEIDFREVELGDQKEIAKACTESKYVEDWEVVATDDEAKGSGLAIGDIVINDMVCIERKAPGDFISSMQDGHLEDQLARMYDAYEHVYVLVSGTMTDLKHTRSNINWNAVRAFVASMSVRWQTVPLFCGSERELAFTAIDLGRKSVEPLKRRPGRPDIDVDTELGTVGQATMLVDGVGPSTAEKVEEKFWSVSDLLEASAGDLSEIDGIGPKTASKIKTKLQ